VLIVDGDELRGGVVREFRFNLRVKAFTNVRRWLAGPKRGDFRETGQRRDGEVLHGVRADSSISDGYPFFCRINRVPPVQRHLAMQFLWNFATHLNARRHRHINYDRAKPFIKLPPAKRFRFPTLVM